MSPSLAKQKAGWEARGRRMGEKGESEGGGRSRACWWLPLPWDPAHPPAARLERGRGQGRIVPGLTGPGGGGGGGGGAAQLCQGGGALPGLRFWVSLSPSVSPRLPTSLCVSLGVSAVPQSVPPLSLWPPVLVSVSLTPGVPLHRLSISLPSLSVGLSASVSRCLWEGGPPGSDRRSEEGKEEARGARE